MSPTQKKLLMYGVPIVVALGLFALIRSRSSSTASGSVSGSTSSGDTPIGLGQLANFENTVGGQIAALGQAVSALQSGTTQATPAPAPSAPAPSGQGFGQTTVGGQTFDILGINSASGPQGYSGYNVSGGAPVFYLAPGSTTPTEGSGQAVVGAEVLVPSIYSPFISETPTHLR